MARYASLAGVLAALALLASGCGGSKSPSVASAGTTTSSTAAGGTDATGSGAPPATQTQLQQDALKYSRCMRASGVPAFPDPQPGGGFLFKAGAGVDPSSPTFKAADAKCRKVMPGGGPPGPGTATHPSAQWLAHMVKVAGCMRRHGVTDFPDPSTSVPANPFPTGSGGGVISDIDGVILVFPSATDMQSPLFTRAAAACKFPLHNH